MKRRATGDGQAGDFRPVSSPNLPDLVVKAIQRRIESGDLRPGDRLPAEPELAASFGIGRSSVREALKALTLMGLVRRSNAGTFVDEAATGSGEDQPSLGDQDPFIVIGQLFRARLMIEPGIAGIAANAATPQDIETLSRTVTRVEESDRVIDLMSADLDFHRHVTIATHDPVLIRLGNQLHADLAIAHKTYLSVWDKPETKQHCINSHTAIIQALRDRDAGTAEELVREVLVRSRNRTRDLFTERRANSPW